MEGDAQVPVLRAELGNVDGQSNPADVNLAERIGNQDGQLVFCMSLASREAGSTWLMCPSSLKDCSRHLGASIVHTPTTLPKEDHAGLADVHHYTG